MRILDPKVWLAGASLVLVGVLAFRDAADPGPGPLHPVHAAMSELAGRDGCVVCHGEQGSPMAMAQSCLDCHGAIEGQIEGGTGLHGQLGGDLLSEQAEGAARCDVCHGEHHGDSITLVGDLAFVRAGHDSLDAYDHAGLGFGLEGAHASLACEECHGNARVEVLAQGQARFLGLAQKCTQCHEDPHEGKMSANCADCHGQSEAFAAVAAFEHPDTFPLTPPHAEIACSQCHEDGVQPAASPASLTHAIASLAVTRTCSDCHESSHTGEFLAEVAVDCAACHGGGATTFLGADEHMTIGRHAATGFALDGAHARVDCAGCHVDTGSYADRYLARTQSACADCHEDVHRGAFDGMTLASAATGSGKSPLAIASDAAQAVSCATCHTTDSFKLPEDAPFDHGRFTGFELTGAHSSANCTACHGEAPAAAAGLSEGQARDFGFVGDLYPGDTGQCSTCHDDVHAGAFDPETVAARSMADRTEASLLAATLSRGESAKDCATCHTTDRFEFPETTSFDHGRWTGFRLEGAHAAAECVGCHGPAEEEPRNFGLVAEHHDGDPRTCSTCHESPHGDRFVEMNDPETGLLDCQRCHTVRDFLEIRPGTFDHGEATGFVLAGAHAQAKCTVCHVPAKNDAVRLGKVENAFPGNTERCATCHRDPHRGAFRTQRVGQGALAREIPNDCSTCHGPASFHVTEPFDHGKWTGWPLENSHAEVACVECHAAQPVDPLGRTRGFAKGNRCTDCHADPHLGQFNQPVKGKAADLQSDPSCVRCHTTEGPFDSLVFDHDTARFALDSHHAELACHQCHKTATTKDGRTAVRYRPLGTECVDCHGVTFRRGDK
ncbi:Class III cytochrome C family protein [Planctomycetes bacterium Poly30]|uniref:Class III cytochrome C family protein n=1 Tax=Saltatorellus ferox TaxID=2528018 RepID=A0A518EME2_9BACT|nr:Class III cytochrome C family protein [Planctomycetes bacterium Poly30]